MEAINTAVESRAVFRREDYAIAGCIATIGNDGGLRLIQGLVKPEDMPAQTGGDDANEGHDTSGRLDRPAIAGPAATPADPRAQARKEAGVGIGLADDLRSIRTALVKAHLAEDFEAAFDLMLFQLARSVFTHGYRAHALDIAIRETPDRPSIRMNDDAFAGWSPGEGLLAERSGLAFDWLEQEDDGEAFAALRALPAMAKQALFAACGGKDGEGPACLRARCQARARGDHCAARHRLRRPGQADG